MQIGETGPHDDHHADEAHHHGGPAGADFFTGDRDGEGDHEQRRGEADGHRVGQRNMRDRGEKAESRGQQQHPSQQGQAEPPHRKSGAGAGLEKASA